MATFPKTDMGKLDYEPVPQSEENQNQNHDKVLMNLDPSKYGVGHDQPDPFRHLDK